MKSEERHRLQENELERIVERMAPSASSFIETYGNRLLLWGCGLAIVAAVTIFWFRSRDAESSAGWTEMLTASTAEEYANIAENHPQTLVGTWAMLNEANRRMSTGIDLMFSDRKGAVEELDLAKEKFEEILEIEGKATSDDIRERAYFGLATTLESTSDEDTTAARDVYEKLLNEYPETIYKELVEKRVDALKGAESKDFYAWFSGQNPKPGDRTLPSDLLGGSNQQPNDPFLTTLPEIPDLLKLPEGMEGTESDSPKGTAPLLPELPDDQLKKDGSSPKESVGDEPTGDNPVDPAASSQNADPGGAIVPAKSDEPQ